MIKLYPSGMNVNHNNLLLAVVLRLLESGQIRPKKNVKVAMWGLDNVKNIRQCAYVKIIE